MAALLSYQPINNCVTVLDFDNYSNLRNAADFCLSQNFISTYHSMCLFFINKVLLTEIIIVHTMLRGRGGISASDGHFRGVGVA